MVGQAIRRRATACGLRPFDPARDVGQVSALLRDAFGDELTAEDLGMLRSMDALRYAAPLLWVLNQISPEFQAAFGGFVWVEAGRVVGNASLTCPDEGDRHWIVSNVAVAPEYRRRGIGSELMQAAIEAARDRGGQAVTLQVRSDNQAAQSLYQRLGFERLESTAYLWLDRVTSVPRLPKSALARWREPGRAETSPVQSPMESHRDSAARTAEVWDQLRPWDRSGNRKAYELALNLAPEALKRTRPLRRQDFSLPPQHPVLSWLLGLAWGRVRRGWAIQGEGRYLATLVLDVAVWRGDHHLQLLIEPDLWGHVEGLLVSHALNFLSRQRPRPVEAQVRADHQEAIKRLQQYGFVTRRVLDRMGLELVRP